LVGHWPSWERKVGGREMDKNVRIIIPNQEIKVLKQESSFMVKYVIGGKL
jgi:hypothetical protein